MMAVAIFAVMTTVFACRRHAWRLGAWRDQVAMNSDATSLGECDGSDFHAHHGDVAGLEVTQK